MKLFNKNILILYVLISILAIVVLPAYVFFFLPSKFTELIVENNKNEAVRVTNHLISMFIENETDLSNSTTVTGLQENDETIRKDFHLTKLKLFKPDGEIIYSSTPEDIGEINKRSYFFDIVAQGKTYPKLVKKDTQTLEGQLLTVDVVETYVPIMRDGVFLGAFEIYYDITPIKERLDALMNQVYVALLLISGCLLSVVILSSIKAKRNLDERNRYEKKLRELSVTDDLTGLLNRRGFMKIAEKQINISDRTEDLLFLFYADIDNMKAINDNWGHNMGDQSLKETAKLLRETFRKSDILSRLGGDEFAVLAIGSSEEKTEETIIKRFHENLEKLNRQHGRKYELQISFGLARYSADKPCELEELVKRADKVMYESKMMKKALTN